MRTSRSELSGSQHVATRAAAARAALFVHGESIPGAALLGLWPCVGAAAVAFNVYYLRLTAPGIVSGKLSDLGINFLLPVLLHSAFEWCSLVVAWRLKHAFGPLRATGTAAACLLSAAYFVLLKCVPSFTFIHVALLRFIAVPFGVHAHFRNIADPSDLITLISTVFAWWYLTRYRQRTQAKPA